MCAANDLIPEEIMVKTFERKHQAFRSRYLGLVRRCDNNRGSQWCSFTPYGMALTQIV
jgi:hypothetical protein